MSGKSLRQLAPASKTAKSYFLNTSIADAAASHPFAGSPIDPRSMISIAGIPLPEVASILNLANTLEHEDPATRSRRLAHRRVALLFYESSTRTRTSFELAAKSLGAETTLVSALSSSIEKGESLKDTGLTLRALGAEAIILRHPNSGAASLLAHTSGLPVINAGDGMHEHPSQALLDLRTILARLHPGKSVSISDQTLRGLTLTICGDIRHSRVARSNAHLLPRLGARVLLCGPPELLPDHAAALFTDAAGKSAKITGSLSIRRDFDRCLRESDVVMMLRIQKERLHNLNLDLDAYIAKYQLNPARLAATNPKILVMHPGPMIRGLEITSEVADSPQSAIEEQVAHGIPIRMALLVRALTPMTPPAAPIAEAKRGRK
jgi:aspartate carbamoyltransferase catalytic subunit